MTERELFGWKEKVMALDIAEIRLERAYREGRITENKKRKIKKMLNKFWIKIWEFHPDLSGSEKEFFKLNFW